MKSLIIAAGLTALAVASPLSAQGRGNSGRIPPGQMPSAGMCRVWIDGVAPGRQPSQTDCATARAQAARTGGRVIYGGSSNRQDCSYNQTTNTVGDIIFGRNGTNTNNVNCRNNSGDRVDGSWRPVGRDGNGNTIYERRVRDNNGNVIIQRARRDTFGNMSIIDSRTVGSNGTFSNNRRHGDDQGDDDDDDDDGGNFNRGRSNRGSDDFNRGNSERHGHGRGKGHKGRD
jgi:hypothetical protein